MENIGLPEVLLILGIIIIFATIILIPYWRIFKKAGFHPALSLLMVVPLVNLAMIYFLGFADWPSLKQAQK